MRGINILSALSYGQVMCRCPVNAASLLRLIVTTLSRYLGATDLTHSISGCVHHERIGEIIVVLYIQQQLCDFLLLVRHIFFGNHIFSTSTLHAEEQVLYIIEFFNHGTHAITLCVRTRLGVRHFSAHIPEPF